MTMSHEALTYDETLWHDGSPWPAPIANEPFASMEELFSESATLARGLSDGLMPDPALEGTIYDLDGTNPEIKADPPLTKHALGSRRHLPVKTALSDEKMLAMMSALVNQNHTEGIDLVLDEEKVSVEVAQPPQTVDQSVKDNDSRFLVDQTPSNLQRLERPADDNHLFPQKEEPTLEIGDLDQVLLFPEFTPPKTELGDIQNIFLDFTPTNPVEKLVDSQTAEEKVKSHEDAFALGLEGLTKVLKEAPVLARRAPEASAPKKGLFARAAQHLHRKPREVRDWRPGLVDRIRYSPRSKRVLGTIAVAGVIFAGATTAAVKLVPERQEAVTASTATPPEAAKPSTTYTPRLTEQARVTTTTTVRPEMVAVAGIVQSHQPSTLDLSNPETAQAFVRFSDTVKAVDAKLAGHPQAEKDQMVRDILEAAKFDASKNQ